MLDPCLYCLPQQKPAIVFPNIILTLSGCHFHTVSIYQSKVPQKTIRSDLDQLI